MRCGEGGNAGGKEMTGCKFRLMLVGECTKWGPEEKAIGQCGEVWRGSSRRHLQQ